MPRRASSSLHPVWILSAIAVLVGALSGGYYIYGIISDPFRTLAPLELPIYMENSNSLRGNTYKVTGTIGSKLAWSQSQGSLYSVEVGNEVVSLLLPAEFNSVNIQKGQRFIFRVEVREKGVLVALDLTKA